MLTVEDFLTEDEDDGTLSTADRDFENTGDVDDEDQENQEPEPIIEEPVEVSEDPENVELEASTETTAGVIETFLERYNILGGLVETEDGKQVEFKSLTPEQQVSALAQIVDATRPQVEEELGLSEDEIDLLNKVRQSKLSINDFMVQSAQEYGEGQQVQTIFNAPEYQFEAMESDVIYLSYLKANSPESTEDELMDELNHAKQSKLYNTTVESLRASFIENRENYKVEYTNQQIGNRTAELNAMAPIYVSTARGISEVSGWPVSDDEKDEILADLIEPGAGGKNAFTREIAENPENAFKALWFLKHGDRMFVHLDNYYKNKMQEVYDKGLVDGDKGKKPATARVSAIKAKDTGGSPTNSGDMSMQEFLDS